MNYPLNTIISLKIQFLYFSLNSMSLLIIFLDILLPNSLIVQKQRIITDCQKIPCSSLRTIWRPKNNMGFMYAIQFY